MTEEYVSVAELKRVEERFSRQIEFLHQTQLLLIKELARVTTAASFGEPGLRSLRKGKSFLQKDYFPAVKPTPPAGWHSEAPPVPPSD